MMEVAGINTNTRYGSPTVGNHIDFISRDTHPDIMVWNQVNYNNGIAAETSPWKASDLYHKQNSLQGEVPGATTAEGTPLIPVDYRTTGVLDKIPAACRNLIIQKRLLLPRRYSAGNLLIDNNLGDWKDAGFLWVPSELEVFGTNIWGSNLSPNQGYDTYGFQQYPIFATNMKCVKGAGNGGGQSHWWLLSPEEAIPHLPVLSPTAVMPVAATRPSPPFAPRSASVSPNSYNPAPFWGGIERSNGYKWRMPA